MESAIYILKFRYSFESELESHAYERYVKKHEMRMVVVDELDREVEEVGRLSFLMVYMDEINQANLNCYHVLDDHSLWLRASVSRFLDFETGSTKEQLRKYNFFNMTMGNICFIENIQLIPKYRGHQIGAKAIRDLVFHYSHLSTLFVFYPYPSQFEHPHLLDKPESLDLKSLDEDMEKSTFKLMAFFQNLGFEAFPETGDLMFINTAFRNSKMEAIDLEEDFDFGKIHQSKSS